MAVLHWAGEDAAHGQAQLEGQQVFAVELAGLSEGRELVGGTGAVQATVGSRQRKINGNFY